jgi:acetolactate synthase-1/2/3 large subunit
MRALAAAQAGQIATLILPADVSWSEGGSLAPPRPAGTQAGTQGSAQASTQASTHHQTSAVDHSQLSTIAHLVTAGPATVLFLGGRALTGRGLRAASRIAAATGARLLAETFPARMERGAGLPSVDRLAYLAESAGAQLAGLTDLVLAGARAPVSFFAYPGKASDLVPAGCAVTTLADREQDVEGALEELADLVAAGTAPVLAEAAILPAEPGPLNAISLANTIAASLPEHVIIADEANTSGFALPTALAGAPRHTLLTLTGGSIGQGMPAATGAAVAAPDRPVLSLEADGSALYTLQALWTQAREQLDVTTVLINNAAYAILRMELARTAAGQAGQGQAGQGQVGERAARMLDLSGPTPDFTQLSQGFGVPASRVTTTEELDKALRVAYSEPGPHLIEAIVPAVAPPPSAGAW